MYGSVNTNTVKTNKTKMRDSYREDSKRKKTKAKDRFKANRDRKKSWYED